MLNELKNSINKFFNKVYNDKNNYTENLFFSAETGFYVVNNNITNVIAKDKNTAFMVFVMNKLQNDAKSLYKDLNINEDEYIYIARFSLLAWKIYFNGSVPEEIEYYYEEFINKMKKNNSR